MDISFNIFIIKLNFTYYLKYDIIMLKLIFYAKRKKRKKIPFWFYAIGAVY